MALIKCGGCESVHESTSPACPVCGRCPNCGERRFTNRELAERSTCAVCGTPYCHGCGRCHGCGTVRFQELGPHSCGFPADEERVREVEEAFGLDRPDRGGGGGCLTLIIAIIGALAEKSGMKRRTSS